MGAAVMSVFAVLGFYMFLIVSVCFLCGLYEERRLAMGAVIMSYVSGTASQLAPSLYVTCVGDCLSMGAVIMS